MKKPSTAERAAPPRTSDDTKAFLKDRERLSRSGREDMRRLKGNGSGHRECHVGGDFLLAYTLDETAGPGIVVFVRAGTHVDLFGT